MKTYIMHKVIIAVKCILEQNNKILFIKEPKKSSWRPGTWSLPGGKIDPNESYLDAVSREMKEETGLRVKVNGLLKIIEIIRDINKETRLVHHYIFSVKKTGGNFKNPDYHVEDFSWFTKNDVSRMPIKNLSEYYYKDLIREYFAYERKVVDLSLMSVFDTNKNLQFKEWSSIQ